LFGSSPDSGSKTKDAGLAPVVIIPWWSIGDGNRTLGDDPEGDIREIRELLDESDSADAKGAKS